MQKSCAALREIVDAAQVETVNIQSFLKIVRRYTDPAELTPAILREFVDKIVVHEADRSSGHRVQMLASGDNRRKKSSENNQSEAI